MNALHGSPNNRQATGLGGKGINLVSALAHIAEKTQSAHWCCECSGASLVESHKRLRDGLHLRLSSAPLRDNTGCILRMLAAKLTNASSFFS